MGLRFILGPAGSGKTWTCLEEMRQELKKDPLGAPLLLLVPEQATFQMEYALLSDSELEGSVRAGVWSFKRLSWKILEEQGELK
ncbi:MAG: hypothetical protein GX767_07995, partial [Firmicutes bacterium]|nr:hypothetical protein [Bacillota bacterium]